MAAGVAGGRPHAQEGLYSDYSDEETEFLKAVDAYKLKKNVVFLPYTEVLMILKSLGWRKVAVNADAAEIPRENSGDL